MSNITASATTVTETKIVDEAVLKFCSLNSTMEQCGLSRMDPGNQILREGHIEYHQQIEDFEVFEDDIWICVFPKAGKKQCHTVTHSFV